MKNPEEVSRELGELEDKWRAVGKECERLSNYKLGFDDEFKSSLNSIAAMLEECETRLNKTARSLKFNFPSFEPEIDRKGGEILESLREMKGRLEADKKGIIDLKRMKKKLKDKKEELERIEGKFREVENQTSQLCTKYFERRREYTMAYDKVREAVDAKISGVRKIFNENIGAIVEGYDVYLEGQRRDLDELFDILLDRPDATTGLSLKARERGLLESLMGKASKIDNAKTIVLQHETQGILARAAPIKRAEMDAMRKLESKFKDLRGLEKACKGAENRREELMKVRNGLRSEIERMKGKEAFSYSDRKIISSVGGEYLDAFNGINAKMQGFFYLVKDLLKDYEAEPDAEKREMALRIKALEKENLELQQKLEGVQAEYDALKGELKKEVEEVEAEVRKRMEGRPSRELEDCRRRLEEMTFQLAEVRKQIDSILNR
jgi:small-conductance mechanosensitive channel